MVSAATLQNPPLVGGCSGYDVDEELAPGRDRLRPRAGLLLSRPLPADRLEALLHAV
jgi:hypothetical protein